MSANVSSVLRAWTRTYCQHWQHVRGHPPASAELLGVPSPCLIESRANVIFWRPQPFSLPVEMRFIERSLNVRVIDDTLMFYTSQFAGDMYASFAGSAITLIQPWNEQDFMQLQQNLIQHLVLKRRLGQTPTLFIATTTNKNEVISVCNVFGEVVLEQPDRELRRSIAHNITSFLAQVEPASLDFKR